RQHAGRIDDVLHAVRNPVERPPPAPRSDLGLRPSRVFERAFCRQREERRELRIQRIDPAQVCFYHLDRGDVLLPDAAREIVNTQMTELPVAHRFPLAPRAVEPLEADVHVAGALDRSAAPADCGADRAASRYLRRGPWPTRTCSTRAPRLSSSPCCWPPGRRPGRLPSRPRKARCRSTTTTSAASSRARTGRKPGCGSSRRRPSSAPGSPRWRSPTIADAT